MRNDLLSDTKRRLDASKDVPSRLLNHPYFSSRCPFRRRILPVIKPKPKTGKQKLVPEPVFQGYAWLGGCHHTDERTFIGYGELLPFIKDQTEKHNAIEF